MAFKSDFVKPTEDSSSSQNNSSPEKKLFIQLETSQAIYNSSISLVYSRTMKPGFPVKLHEMLEEAEKVPRLSRIVSWQPHGRSFMVHDQGMFVEEVAKRG